MKSFPLLRVLDAPLSQGMTRGFSVIPGRSPRERTFDVQLHIRESRDSGSARFAACPE
jgi:hypothetical protein